jgi:hypothetical protein
MDPLDLCGPLLPDPTEESGAQIEPPTYEQTPPPPTDPWLPVYPPSSPTRQDEAPVYPNF